MLLPHERVKLGLMLGGLVGGQPQAVLSAVFPRASLPSYPAETGLPAAIAFLNACSPAQLQMLLKGLWGESEMLVAGILQRIAGNVVSQNLGTCTELVGRVPFVNRGSLRQQLQVLLNPNAEQRILIVRSRESGSGKSFTATVIKSLGASANAPLISSTCDLADGAGGIDDIAQHLVLPLDPNAAPPERKNLDSTDQHHRNTVAKWLVRKATEAPKSVWFVLDSFKKTHVRQRADLDTFVAEVSDLVARHEGTNGPRLVLLDFDGVLPPFAEERALRDEITARLTTIDIDVFLQKAVADPGQRQTIFNQIKDCPCEPEHRLEIWHEILRRELA